MNELPKTVDLDIPLTAEERAARIAVAHAEHQRLMSAQVGAQAVERELFPSEPGTKAVEISLWVKGREVRATTDPETIQRIMAILVGIEP